jgi:hypothetical protein
MEKAYKISEDEKCLYYKGDEYESLPCTDACTGCAFENGNLCNEIFGSVSRGTTMCYGVDRKDSISSIWKLVKHFKQNVIDNRSEYDKLIGDILLG